MWDASYRINDPDVVSEEFDGEFLVLDLAKGTYFSFHESGNLVWRALLSGHSPAAISDALDDAGNKHKQGADQLIQRILDLGLVRAEASAAADGKLLTEVATIDSEPALSAFDDLADLILADPIHDVDAETGWPSAPRDRTQ